MKLEVSLSAAGDNATVLEFTGTFTALRVIKNGVEAGALKHDPFSHQIQVLLAKTGAHTSSDLWKAFRAFHTKASKNEQEAFLAAKDLKKMVEELKTKITFRKKAKAYKWFSNRNPTATNYSAADQKAAYEGVAMMYTYIARKLCSMTGTPFKPAIVSYMMTGKAPTSVPLPIKKIFSGAAVKGAQKAASDSRTIDQLTLKDFKTYNPDLVVRLKDMFKEYMKANKAKTVKVYVPNRVGGMRSRYSTYLTKRNNRITNKHNNIVALRQAVGEDLFTFYTHVIPELHKLAVKEGIGDTKVKVKKNVRPKAEVLPEELAYRKAYSAQVKLSGGRFGPSSSRRLGGGVGAPTPARMARAKRFADAKKATAEAKKAWTKAKKAAKLAKADKHSATIKKWMIPYMGTHNDISKVKGASKIVDPALLAHRLVTKANAGKLKASSVELQAVLDENSAVTLTYKGVGNITAAVGSTIKASKTIFADCLSVMAPKMFVVGVSDNQGNTPGISTDLGRVTNGRLLRLNRITKDDADTILKQFAAEFKKWNPLKTEVTDVAASLNVSAKVKAGKMRAVEVSAAQTKQYSADIQQFTSGLHHIGLKIIQAWDVTPSKAALTALKNLKNSSNIHVIRNVFHGCARQTGSMILHAGFKISGTKVTARSMGDVLYIAPCADKSAQYVGASGFTRKDGQKGIIFMGDVILKGSPVRNADHAKGSIDSNFGWTKTGTFQTEEIGLINPNMQFLIKHAFLVEVTGQPNSKNPLASKMKNFETAIPIASYSLT